MTNNERFEAIKKKTMPMPGWQFVQLFAIREQLNAILEEYEQYCPDFYNIHNDCIRIYRKQKDAPNG